MFEGCDTFLAYGACIWGPGFVERVSGGVVAVEASIDGSKVLAPFIIGDRGSPKWGVKGYGGPARSVGVYMSSTQGHKRDDPGDRGRTVYVCVLSNQCKVTTCEESKGLTIEAWDEAGNVWVVSLRWGSRGPPRGVETEMPPLWGSASVREGLDWVESDIRCGFATSGGVGSVIPAQSRVGYDFKNGQGVRESVGDLSHLSKEGSMGVMAHRVWFS